MHYAAIISEVFVSGDTKTARRRAANPSGSDQPLHRYVAGAWRNWWAMSVEEPPSPTARQTQVIGARGRMPGV